MRDTAVVAVMLRQRLAQALPGLIRTEGGSFTEDAYREGYKAGRREERELTGLDTGLRCPPIIR